MDDVAKPSGITKRQGSSQWYFRKRCPKHLRRAGVPPEVWITLGTSEYRLALTRLDDARREADRRFIDGVAAPVAAGGIVSATKRRRRPEAPHLPLLTAPDALALARSYFRRSLQDLDASPPFDSLDRDKLERSAQELDDEEAGLRYPDEYEDEEEPTLGVEVGLLTEAGFRSPYASEPSVLLRGYLRRAMLQLVAIERARLRGDYSVGNADPLFTEGYALTSAPIANVSPTEAVSVSVKEAADRYLAELLRATRKEKTQDRYRHEMDHIVSFWGASTSMSEVRRPQCTSLRDTFALLPPNFARRLAGGLSIAEIAARRQPDDRVLAWATHEKYLSAMTRFLSWACKEDIIAKNYAEGLTPLGDKPDGSIAKLPFEDDELRRAFSRPIYTGCVDDRYGFAKPGDQIVRRSRYWAPLIALFSGLRAGEILQLTPDHFRVSPSGHAFIVLTPDMKLKGLNAQREVPVHSTLTGIGLLSWVDRRRKSPHARLFPEVPPDTYDAESPIFSKRFRSDLKHLELGERRSKLTFHSFRHTFKRALDRAGIGEHEKDELCGWARGKKIGRRYGVGLEADLLKPCVEAVQYELDLRHLLPHARMED